MIYYKINRNLYQLISQVKTKTLTKLKNYKNKLYTNLKNKKE